MIIGLLHLKQAQDKSNSKYIHFMGEFPELGQVDDGDADENMAVPLRIAICMSPENSVRLQMANYIQCDIGFK